MKLVFGFNDVGDLVRIENKIMVHFACKFNIFNQISATDYCFSVVGISFLVRAKHGSKQIQMEPGSEENELLVLVGT